MDKSKQIQELYALAIQGKMAQLKDEWKDMNSDFATVANKAMKEVCDLMVDIGLFEVKED